MTISSTSSRIIQLTLDWGRHRRGKPNCWDAILVEVMANRVACVAFLVEAAAEMSNERGSTLDDLGNDTMPFPLDDDLNKAFDCEKDLLDAMLLPGTLVDEAERSVLGLHHH